MMNSPVEEIKNRLDIVDVIGGYLKLKKSGKDYKALCPFHGEKTPSFFVSPSKQIWHCFGCNLGGDIFSFVMQMERVEFADALRALAKKAGVILKKEDPQLVSQRSKVYEICEEAAEFYGKNLEKNKNVLDYLIKNRKISTESIKNFKIGYALDSWDSLYEHLTSIGYKIDDVEKAGLIIKSEKPGGESYYDRFRKRIIFPICDTSGQIVGFTGRIFEGDESTAKYVNSPETLIFNKSQILYGLDKAKTEIRKEDKCILVEGQIDLIMSHQAGVKNSVATSGTALTLDHLQIIKRYTDNLVLAFDTDTAGEAATKKGIGLALRAEFNVRVIVLHGAKDPADIIKENPEAWIKAIENAKPIMEFYFENTFSKYNLDKLEDKRQIAKELLPPIKMLANEIERSDWLKELASRLNVHERDLNKALAKVRLLGEENQLLFDKAISKGGIALEKSRLQSIEEILLGLILKYPVHLDILKNNMILEYFSNSITQKIFQALHKQEVGDEIDLIEFQKKVVPDLPYYLNHIIFQVEHYSLEPKEIIKQINFCIKEIKSNYLKRRLSDVSLMIKKFEREKNKQEVKKLIEEFNKLSKELILL